MTAHISPKEAAIGCLESMKKGFSSTYLFQAMNLPKSLRISD